jgi:hypothetical protein
MYANDSIEEQMKALKLWGAVLEQAIIDTTLGMKIAKAKEDDETIKLIRKQSRAWVLSFQNEIGKFEWICDLFELDPEKIRRGIAKKWEQIDIINKKEKKKGIFK